MKLRVKGPGEKLLESKNLYNLAVRNGKVIKIHNLDVETGVEEVRDLEFPIALQIIQLPNNELFCFGAPVGKHYACIIDCLTLKQRKLIELDKESFVVGASYFKNSIFVWTRRATKLVFLRKYDLTTGKNIVLAPPPIEYALRHDVFEDTILISFSADIYVYDPEINSYSKVKVCEHLKGYFLAPGKTNAYYFQKSGNIYESGFKNPYIWNNIGNSESNVTWGGSYTIYDNCIFLRGNKEERTGNWKPKDSIYVFNLSDKSSLRAAVR